MFRKMRADLASMWSPRNQVSSPRRISAKSSSLPWDERTSSPDDESFAAFDEQVPSMKVHVLYEQSVASIYLIFP